MDYAGIKVAAYDYADRSDALSQARYDDFLRIVEAKMNRRLKTLQSTERASIPILPNKEYYGLPANFEGLRDIQLNGIGNDGTSNIITAEYKTPAQMNETGNVNIFEEQDAVYYNIIDNQIHVLPIREGKTMEIVYYKKVNPLTTIVTTNWVSDENPDCYIFGVATEISAFVKDYDAARQWGARFQEVLNEIEENDFDIRWDSGNQLIIRAE